MEHLAYNFYSIIQDCEDALTNWVEQHASVKPKLSTRARTLSQRRKAATGRQHGEGVDLSHQDQPLESRESGLWVPAEQHHQQAGERYEEDEDDEAVTANGEQRGREEERPQVAS